ncbi:hypothetical protein B0H16DRAFT_1271885, partial [Mycena metata]
MTNGDEDHKDSARDLIRKMVNSMAAKMEIGSPMASMYLLENPDHYASHKYVVFYWHSYVQFVRAHWTEETVPTPDMDIDHAEFDEKVPLGKQDGKIIATSAVDDYRYRPTAYNGVTLFEWVQCAQKRLRTKKQRTEFEEELSALEYEDNESDWETEDEDDVVVSKESEKLKNLKPVQLAFQPDHPLFYSHSVSCDFSRVACIIPNFIGGAMPRADKGDRAYYCMTMLTMFKAWRSPGDLKDENATWDQTFREHAFTERQLELLSNFNVRYECNDARDDHYANLRKKMAEAQAGFTSHFAYRYVGDHDETRDDLDDSAYGLEDADDSDDDGGEEDVGPITMRLLREASEMKNIVSAGGWLRDAENHEFDTPDRVLPAHRPRSTWAKIVKAQRAELIANKMLNMPPVEDLINKRRHMTNNGIQILESTYFHPRSPLDVAACKILNNDIITSFDLNEEQTRAFMIVANHASEPQKSPLRMYLGGMGGTGKSRVFKAIVEFFARRNEDYRYLIVAPTGSTAAQLNGST